VLGVDFVVGIGIETAEAVRAGVVRDASGDGLRSDVEKIDDARGNGIVVLVDSGAVNGAKLSFGFFILGAGRND